MRIDKWNIFAKELEEILDQHGYRLGHLDDRAHIHPEKVSRLQRSLHRPKSFPVLNPEELEQVALEFALKEAEVLRLRAALLATAVEEMLMDRISNEDAFSVAEQVLSLILDAVGKQKRAGSWIKKLRSDSSSAK